MLQQVDVAQRAVYMHGAVAALWYVTSHTRTPGAFRVMYYKRNRDEGTRRAIPSI